ncbi:complex I subunit 4 family protein [Streptomonospora litoralis]|uniref:NADH-quinone oxidoreductase subunit M n=1 Tax=Streptomonospora litoralis TaxID=2498135 RepID=A0A4P6Q3F4_9ACTN|nr:NADH-quinone oxidoreductase subunit M [Streptomonospora litoralis]QBI55206.1 NADH-quinone oxidoreductase subunit M [Streptomonospora litoralis]
MLSVVVFLPLLAAGVLAVLPRLADRAVAAVWIAVAGIELVLVVLLWIGYYAAADPGAADTADRPAGPAGPIAYETDLEWIPSLGSGYHIGVDGLSLPLVAMTAVLFLACAVYSLRARQPRMRGYTALFLALQTVSTGLFAALDLLLFFVFFDLSIALMYFVIAGWGHGNPARSALRFFLYTFVGSLALLVGFIGLYLAADPHTFDMVELARRTPLDGRAFAGGAVLLAVGIGLAVKTPLVPFHTWLPPAHTDAPAAGSAILAGVLLKMGAYGFARIAMPILPDAWSAWAPGIAAVGAVSVLYGALVALAQSDFKRMVAYTSVNHMGYVLLGLGAAGTAAAGSGGAAPAAAGLAVSGAAVQLVSHGLLTGALFLLAGVLYERGGGYDMGSYSGLATPAPRFAAVLAVAAFGSLGLPGLSGFIAEFQIFTGGLGLLPVQTALALPGILITAALLLRALQRLLLGGLRLPPGAGGGFGDLRAEESAAVVPLLALSVLIGLLPHTLLDVVAPAASAVADLVLR